MAKRKIITRRKTKIAPKRKTKDKLGSKKRTTVPKNQVGLSKRNIKWIAKAKRQYKFIEWYKGLKNLRRRCMYNIGGSDIHPKQCKRPTQGDGAFCYNHGGKRKGMTSKEIQKLGIYKTTGALDQELKNLEFVPEAELESVNSEVKLMIAHIRNYLDKHSDEDISHSPGNLRILIDSLVQNKSTLHEMKYGKRVSFSLEVVNYMLRQIFVIVTKHISDVETIKIISADFKKLGIEIKTREL